MEIKPLDNQVSQEESVLLQHPFSMLINASRGSGKTTLLIQMLRNPEFYAGKFNEIYIFSPTSFLDDKFQILLNTPNILKKNEALDKIMKRTRAKTYEELVENNVQPKREKFTGKIPVENMFSEYDESILHSIIEFQKDQIKYLGKERSNKTLVVFDDALSLHKSLMSPTGLFKEVSTTLRHFSMSTIVIGQSYNKVLNVYRQNNNGLITYTTNNDKELKNMYDENSMGLSFNDWVSRYKRGVEDKYSFFLINYQQRKCYKNFTEELV